MVTDKDSTTPETTTNVSEDSNNVVPLAATAAKPRPSEKIIAFVKEHPVLTVAGGIAAGIVVSALLPRKASRKLVGKAVNFAEAAGAATAMFGRETGEKAHALGQDARHKADELASRAARTGDAAAARVEKYGLAAMAAAGALARAATRRAEKLGDTATDKGHRIADMASELKQRIKH